jgi:guanylate kinase
MVDDGELLEWAEVFGHLYGTPRAPVEAALAEGRDMLFDIDWQGTQQLGQ